MEIQAVTGKKRNAGNCPVENFGVEMAKKVQKFHESFPEYTVTPLRHMKSLAKQLGVSDIYVKDESFRFGLNAFKVLGGSYCVGKCLAERLGIPIEEAGYETLILAEAKEKTGQLTFVTATDGNHGRGIAWTARKLGHKSVVYMPKGTAKERLENIRALGADASITEWNYDDAVRMARDKAKENGWIMVQDTAWEGYEKIPGWIMQGYTTMAYEAARQLDGVKPTHIFLQAGVGAMAGAVTGFFRDLYGEDGPAIVIAESDKADCLFRTIRADDGKIHNVGGDMPTIMAGLACGEPCTIGFDILKAHADVFVSAPDYVAAQGMRILANPTGDDPRIISGESGAVTAGLVSEVMRGEGLHWLREMTGLKEDSRILCISTEGDTDRENYQRIVWDGAYPRR